MCPQETHTAVHCAHFVAEDFADAYKSPSNKVPLPTSFGLFFVLRVKREMDLPTSKDFKEGLDLKHQTRIWFCLLTWP